MNKTSKLSRDGAVWGLVMVAPTIIGLLVLNIWPFIETIYMSFSKSKAFGTFEFNGLDNYIEMFQSTEFWKATWNSIYFCILTVPVGVFLALLVAVLLNAKLRGRTCCGSHSRHVQDGQPGRAFIDTQFPVERCSHSLLRRRPAIPPSNTHILLARAGRRLVCVDIEGKNHDIERSGLQSFRALLHSPELSVL